ncbi:NUDIX hydrolase [Bacillus sp. FJAT-47783]|uniref:NUDIX hydrolase n=1 Tax=Bacillus sp. FJAT-47783 TaxID=2922712 RepID=UPI001FABEA4E|nr:NUDIX hydrolase [Bacillus sp. FJAT-47783]
MDHLKERTISKEQIFSGKIIDLFVEDVALPNGSTSKREIIKHPGAVAIIAVTDDEKIVMVRQYRKALEKAIVEIPAGKLEKGEEPMETAMRELEEETGYRSQQLKPLISFYTSPGFADELVHVFVAEGLTKMSNRQNLDEDEFVDIVEVTLEEAQKMIETKEIYDAKTAYAVLYLSLKMKKG